MRCRKQHVESGRLVDVAAIRFPDQSVNRSKYSRPYDVLLPETGNEASKQWIYFGALTFSVGSVPACLREGDREICNFIVAHDPLEHNYAHSEIQACVRGVRITHKKKISKANRKRFRLAIMSQAAVALEPVK